MSERSRYYYLHKPLRVEIDKIKGSRFIADAIPFKNQSSLAEELEKIRQDLRNATHHCWAYRIDPDGLNFRYSDDGEPTGTAGAPILRQIESRELARTLVIVTRYYGGIQLGKGGLIRAYGKAASAVLNEAVVKEKTKKQSFQLTFAYENTSSVSQLLARFSASTLRADYTSVSVLTVEVDVSLASQFEEAFVEQLAGQGELTRISQSA